MCVMPASAEDNTTNDSIANNTTNNIINSTPFNISIFDRSVGADVTRNPEINNNIPRTDLSSEILEKQKQGSTIIQFGNGTGTRLLIWAGIHGNEDESNIATMRYIESLKEWSRNNTLNGTMYIVPFGIPQTTAINSRNMLRPYTYSVRVPVRRWVRRWVRVRRQIRGRLRWVRVRRWVHVTIGYRTERRTGHRWEDPNRIANVPGTPGWNAVQFARNNNITHILDVHSGGGLYPYLDGAIFVTTNHIAEANWANFIRYNITNARAAVYDGPGQPGMVRIYGHRYGINTITLEVERDRGCTVHWAGVLYRMIRAGSEYLFPELQNLR